MHKTINKALAALLAVCMLFSMVVIPSQVKAAGNTWYVSYTGDDTNSGDSATAPLANIYTAYEKASDGDTIALVDDFDLAHVVTEFNSDKEVIIDGQGNTVTYNGANIDTTSSGVFKVNSGKVTFTNLTIDVNCAPSSHSGRALYVGQTGYVVLDGVTVKNGSHVDSSMGGGAIYVGANTTVEIIGASVIEKNASAVAGGAIFVASKGTLILDDDTVLKDNTADEGAAIYVTEGGKATINGDVEITANEATTAGGVYVCKGATVELDGDVTIDGNTVAGENNNVYLQCTDANPVTNDTTKVPALVLKSTAAAATIGITAQNANFFRIVTKDDSYAATAADEAGFYYDDGSYIIRQMTYGGISGLYLYHATINVEYAGTENLVPVSGITGKGFNGDTVNYPAELPGNLTGSSELDGYVFNVTANDEFYRIPGTVTLTAIDGLGAERTLVEGTDYIYTPDFAAGTATIKVLQAAIDTMLANGEKLNVCVAALQYFNVSFKFANLDVVLYDYYDDSDDTANTDDADASAKGNHVVLDAASSIKGMVLDSRTNGAVTVPVSVTLYSFDGTTSTVVSTKDTVDGAFDFTSEATNPAFSYYVSVNYDVVFKTIANGYIEATITAHNGFEVPDAPVIVSGGITIADITYTPSADKASATLVIDRNKILADTVISFTATTKTHTVTFDPNGGTVGTTTKDFVENGQGLGETPEPTRPGYTFNGWYTEPSGGEKIDENTKITFIGDVTLYAHWTPNGDVHYEVKQFVELAEGGVNVGYTVGVTETVTVGGKTFYLYQTDSYDNGVADGDVDVSDLKLTSMSDATYTWWTIDGFSVDTVNSDGVKTVAGAGTSVFAIYYLRNVYDVTLVAGDNSAYTESGVATVTSPTVDVVLSITFGGRMGNENHFDYASPSLESPVLPGYTFVKWIDENGDEVTPDTIYTKAGESTLTPVWTPGADTVYVVHFLLQDIEKDSISGRYIVKESYTEVKLAESVVFDTEGNPIGMGPVTYYFTDNTVVKCYEATGATDTVVIVSAPTLKGFKYKSYTSGEFSGEGTDEIKVRVTPTDIAYDASADVDAIDLHGAAELFLKYDRIVNEVEYHPGDGELGDNTPGEIPYGGDYEGQFPDDPTRPGYDFDGWEDEDGDPVDENTPTDEYTDEEGDVHLYPTWTPREYQLTYVVDPSGSFVAGPGGTASAHPTVENGYRDGRTVTYDQPVGTMPTATKVGYTFDKWLMDVSDPATEVNSTTMVTIATMIIKDTSQTDGVDNNFYEETRPLYATFTPNTYTVEFDSGVSLSGVPGSPVAPITVTFDQPYGTLPVPTLTGYSFAGWYTDPSDPATLVIETTIYTIPGNSTLYAKWTPNDYEYTFVLNDHADPEGMGSTDATLTSGGITYTDPTITETFDNPYHNAFEFVAGRIGYDFLGWSLTRNGTPLTATEIVSIAADAKLYACWGAKTFDLIINMNDGFATGAADTEVVFPDAIAFDADYKLADIMGAAYAPVPTTGLTGYTFKFYREGDINLTATDLDTVRNCTTEEDVTLKAIWGATVIVDPNPGKFADDVTAPFTPGGDTPVTVPIDELGELPEVVLDGYTHSGWQDDEGNPVTIDDLKANDEPKTITPIFTPNVTFDAGTNGGKVNGQDTYEVGVATLTSLPGADKSGYVLDGWYTEATAGTKLTLADIQAFTVPTTVYAQFRVYTPPVHTDPDPTPEPDPQPIVVDDKTDGDDEPGGDDGGGDPTPPAPTPGGETVAPPSEEPGKVVEVETNPNPGYEVGEYEVVTEDGDPVPTTPTDDGFSFVMPDKPVHITVIYRPIMAHYLIYDKHIQYIFGYPDGSVKPYGLMTRAEAAQMIYNLLIDKTMGNERVSFSDVKDGSWYYKAVTTLASRGILHGYPDGTFKPQGRITRAELVTIFVRFIGTYDGNYTKYARVQSDVQPGSWYYDYITSALAYKRITGYPDGTFKPNQDITRAEVMTIVNNILLRNADKEYCDAHASELNKFTDLTNRSSWYYYIVVEATNGHEHTGIGANEKWGKEAADSNQTPATAGTITPGTNGNETSQNDQGQNNNGQEPAPNQGGDPTHG